MTAAYQPHAAHPDPRALAARLLADAGLEPGALTVARADLERLVDQAQAFGMAREAALELEAKHCRICGCTRFRACVTADGPCGWAGPDLCTACAPFVSNAVQEGR